MSKSELVNWLPPLAIIVTYSIFTVASFENQRWARARAGGLRGASETVGAFVDATHLLVSTLFRYGFIIAFAFLIGWKQALGLFVVSTVLALLYSALSATVIRGDSLILWIIGTLAVWILAPVLAIQMMLQIY